MDKKLSAQQKHKDSIFTRISVDVIAKNITRHILQKHPILINESLKRPETKPKESEKKQIQEKPNHAKSSLQPLENSEQKPEKSEKDKQIDDILKKINFKSIIGNK